MENTVISSIIDENSIIVWNENLQLDIVINKSVQDDSYTFSVKKDYVVFSFFGYVSKEQCMEIAKGVLLK